MFLVGLFPARGQALSNLQIGDGASKLASFGDKPPTIEEYKSFLIRKWTLLNGNDLSVTASTGNRIVYIESDWGGRTDDPECDLPDLKFGVTTLTDLRKRFGSNGFSFQGRGTGTETSDGVALFNSYEVGGNIVTFITKVSSEEYSRFKNSGQPWVVADHARLDAISIADAGYAKAEWRARVYDPNYKKIDWK
jgi:hypothetical protein